MRVVMLVAVLLMARTVTAQPIERINPPGLSMPTTYSHIVKVGSILYIAGQVGADAQGKVVGSGMVEQVEQVLKNLQIALKSQGVDFSHAAVRAKYFGANRPASTLVGVTRLASPDYKVEIEATAHLPGGVRLLKQ